MTGAILAAHDYLDMGWRVFPAHSIHDGACTCLNGLCTSQGKHPRTRNGLKAATTDTKKINQWINKYPDSNIGIVTGSLSGFFALDVDKKSGGIDSFNKIKDRLGINLDDQLVVDTGGGGFHVYFQMPDFHIANGVSVIAQGIDHRADGGYVVGAPSTHLSGNDYKWRNGLYQPNKAPDELFLLLHDKTNKRGENEQIQSDLPQGKRNDTLFRLGSSLRGSSLEYDEILDQLKNENIKRCRPPLSNNEIESIARSCAKYGKGNNSLINIWRNQLMDDRALGSSTKLLLHTLIAHACNKTLIAYPSQETIAGESGLSRKTIIAHSEIAESLGWIERKRVSRLDGAQGYRYEYMLKFTHHALKDH